ncbi:membrane-spanning 4-domains subfamily A member 4D-like [Poecilia formosa]|uniref:Membrane-spanning 4-domains subfamily A member 4D-like n=1 Tax=Poecilia formosa TaxID=48698 RepID=A0A096M706_POEFO|nr:PREDICTED: membrane-spanning 4-domains subfamily A member 4D-like [Poecilia formosa]XP_016525060.1 PREDICTED: membrane-spanning 4-domains subfamily A member 4D-like [Poecilia formosa]
MEEETESTVMERPTGENENQKIDESLLLSSKPLHRFVRKQPRSFGIVILMFGCAEVVMGFVMVGNDLGTSLRILYIPFWQGTLFITCGVLSIYTELHPSKKMVTSCLALYVVSLLGIIVTISQRIPLIVSYTWRIWHYGNHLVALISVEGILLGSSLLVSAFLIFLSALAGYALRSTRSQIVVQHFVMHPQSEEKLT